MFARMFLLIFVWQVFFGLLGSIFHPNCFRAEILAEIVEVWPTVPLIERINFFLLLYLSAFLEEFIFRYLPAKIFTTKIFFLSSWLPFLISSFVFGFAHRFLIVGSEVFIERDWFFHFFSSSVLGALFWLSYHSFQKKKLLSNANVHFLSNAFIFSLEVLSSII